MTTVIHSRPEARGAMDPARADAPVTAFEDFEADTNAAVAVFWGEGGAFCSGWDLKYASALQGQADPLGELAFPLDDSACLEARWGPAVCSFRSL